MLKNFRIDPHVHFRDREESYKETIAHGLFLAENQGVGMVFDMPNTKPSLLGETELKERLKLVPKNKKKKYFVYMGLSSDKKQIKQAVYCWKKYKEVIGFKMYAGESVGNLGVISVQNQDKIYEALTSLGYEGVLAVHCEKKKYLKESLFNPKDPESHFRARPKKSEIEAIKDQIKLAKKNRFKGHLHITHISSPESVELIEKAREDISISCGITPHHILWNKEKFKENNGILYKSNPPLREKKDVIKLRNYLKQGKIDWIETDYAPHAISEKLFSPYCSGFPSLCIYKNFIEEFLPKLGLSKKEIERLTFENIYKVFKHKLGKIS